MVTKSARHALSSLMEIQSRSQPRKVGLTLVLTDHPGLTRHLAFQCVQTWRHLPTKHLSKLSQPQSAKVSPILSESVVIHDHLLISHRMSGVISSRHTASEPVVMPPCISPSILLHIAKWLAKSSGGRRELISRRR